MRRNLLLIFAISMLLLSPSSGNISNEELEWKVSVGDSKTYTWTKIYIENDSSHQLNYSGQYKGEEFNFTVTQGEKFEVLITELGEYHAKESFTYNSDLTIGYFPSITYFSFFIRKSTENISYWEEYAQNLSEDTKDHYFNVVINGNIITETLRSGIDWIGKNIVFEDTIKFNCKSGWRTECTRKAYERTDTTTWKIDHLREEISFSSSANSIPITIDFYLLMGLIMCTVYYRKKRKMENKR